MAVYIDPLKFPGELLLTIEKPARYTGGEYGSLAKRDALLQTLIAFPDLYEIGMSNQAFRIIYNELNRLSGISCDRAFAPAPDFEELLRSRNIPLYGLDTGIALGDLDLLMFTLGYELGITGVLTMLDRGFIPLRRTERGEGDPIVIMGGPCVSNPLPYDRFIDAFWIGEAEAGFFDLAVELRDMKQAGAGRGDLLSRLHDHPSVWTGGKKKAVRAIDRDFALRPSRAAVFPIPGMKAVQNHGAVEIMRGCPNGCRFCHAGIWYRPMRQKSAAVILEEAAAFINSGGYREISLSSLSTGDYRHIDPLVESLNNEYASAHISFQLPSLRVSTFSLPLLEKVSAVRKSGLTFAVETPAEAWQMAVNKEVSRDNVVAILQEARRNGWRGAKFYFMVGLPVGDYRQGYGQNREDQEIVEFIRDVARRTGMHFSINVGAFIPKPHTPYQWVAQVDEKTAREKIEYIRNSLKPLGHKVGMNDPFIALIEGVLSRGDERVGDLLEEAYARGCRLDAWDEYIKKDVWSELLDTRAEMVGEFTGSRDTDKPLPWECIESGVSQKYLKQEYEKSIREEITSICINNCKSQCGICNKEQGVVYNSIQDNVISHTENPISELKIQDPLTVRVLFSFEKKESGVFLPHLALIDLFSMAFIRAGIPVLFTQGYNPIPRLDFASPLSLGIRAGGEIASVDLDLTKEAALGADDFVRVLNRVLPRGFTVTEAAKFLIPSGTKKRSISSLLWGYRYESPGFSESSGTDLVPAAEEKNYRASGIASPTGLYGLYRREVLAKSPDDPSGGPDSYFNVYRKLYTS